MAARQVEIDVEAAQDVGSEHSIQRPGQGVHDLYRPNPNSPARVGTKVPEGVDPVCGMTVDPAQAAARREHQDRTYYFCSAACADQFDAEPEAYVPPQGPARRS